MFPLQPRGQPGNASDFVDEPGTGVDLVYKKGFTLGRRDLGFDFKVQNILGNEFSETQSGFGGNIDVNKYDLGTTISPGLSATF